MKVLLVCPRFPESLWSFSGITPLVGARTFEVPIGLATVAALTPSDWQIRIVDENIEAIDFDVETDVVGISLFNVQFRRAVEIAAEFRRRGRWVVAGGPYPTLRSDACAPHFDAVFEGEAELTWPAFCRDFARGVREPLYRQDDKIDITTSPPPRNDLMDAGAYVNFGIQTTRGCPFDCEFCDIIVTDGRRPRTKTVDQVMVEVESIRRAGGQYAVFTDANLIADPRFARRLLTALRDWGRAHRFPLRFSAEVTLNVADMSDILDLLQQANFESVFVGIESPRPASLTIASKQVNLRGRGTLVDKIARIQARNLIVIAGMIVGFDTDDHDIFEEQVRMLDEAGIPFTTSGVLVAIERTPLHERLKAAGRLLEWDMTTTEGHGAADLNFTPKLMSAADLLAGYNWMIRRHYRYDTYRRRLVTALARFERTRDPAMRSALRFDRRLLLRGLRIIVHYLTSGGAKRRFFLGTLGDIARTGLTGPKIVLGITFLAAHKHFHEFVTAVHGDPETVAGAIAWPDGRQADRRQVARPYSVPTADGLVTP